MEDFFEDALGSFFQQPQFALGTPGAIIQYKRPSTGQILPIRLCIASDKEGTSSQDYGVLHALVRLMAHYLWKSSQIMADLIDMHVLDTRRKRVVELGAGAGLPSLVASLNGAKRVVVTDYPSQDILDNLEYNKNRWSEMAELDDEVLQVHGHDWGTRVDDLIALNEGGLFDVVILADTCWLSDLHERLLQSIESLLGRGGEVWLTCCNHAAMSCDSSTEDETSDNLTATSRAFIELAQSRSWFLDTMRPPNVNAEHVFIGTLKRV